MTTTTTQLNPRDVVAEKYEIDSLLGAGAQGPTFLARDIVSGRKVALKVLAGRPATDEHAQEVLRRSQALTHEGIVRLRDTGIWEEPGTRARHRWVTMDYIEGDSLRRAMDSLAGQQQCYSVQEAAQVLVTILEAVAYAHAPDGFTHRHLKPTNIMVPSAAARGRRSVQILGFGISDLVAEEVLQRASSTPYHARETVDAYASSSNLDTYAAGVIFYELLCGQPPKGTYLPPSRVRDLGEAPLPQRIDAIIFVATNFQPDERYPSAANMLVDVKTVTGVTETVGRGEIVRVLANAALACVTALPPLIALGAGVALLALGPAQRWSTPLGVLMLGVAPLSAVGAVVRHGYRLRADVPVRFGIGASEVEGVVARVGLWFTELRADDGSVMRVPHHRLARANVRRLDLDGLSWVNVHVHAERACQPDVEDAFHALKRGLATDRGFDTGRALEWALVAVDAATCSWVLRVPVTGHRFVRTMEDIVLGRLAAELEDSLVLATTEHPRGRTLTAADVDAHLRHRADEVVRLGARWEALGLEPLRDRVGTARDLRMLRARVVEQERLRREVRAWEDRLRALGDSPAPLTGLIEPAQVRAVRDEVSTLEAHRARAQDVDDARRRLGLHAWPWRAPIRDDQVADAQADTHAAELRLAGEAEGPEQPVRPRPIPTVHRVVRTQTK
jgi:hypothetical protein